MARVEKTVFISYRRSNVPWALAVFQYLTRTGYDVFFDFQGIASGDFESVILDNIKSRAHFLVLLTPSALERCDEPGDWLRREIEYALEHRRNIIPLILESFDFGLPSIKSQLTGKLAALTRYNALKVPPEYFDAAMTRLHEHYLNVPLDAILHPASEPALQAVKEQQEAAATARSVEKVELTAQDWFEQGFTASSSREKIHAFSQAIRLKPEFSGAFVQRGNAELDIKNFENARKDFAAALEIAPSDPDAYCGRGVLRQLEGDIDGALQDFSEAIRLQPTHTTAFAYLGAARHKKGDSKGAVREFSKVIALKPNDAMAYHRRGLAHHGLGKLESALNDLNEAIRIKPNFAQAFNDRGLIRYALNDLHGAESDFTLAIQHKITNERGHFPRYRYSDGRDNYLSGNDGDVDMLGFKNAVRPDSSQFPVEAESSLRFSTLLGNRARARAALGDVDGAKGDSLQSSRIKGREATQFVDGA
ncbi:tetratricopeptide repeat protein [Variovorax sp. J22P240]|uniref:toll/interleukin-1 receptor domain-containing protein n=1 Tax=Variovorax sp. J22P240 TaxID=3053514 RepID=UPI0025754685|nr:toll/interleukin-1 receptor domain-containing protein [Variovorax sp. J22P240]MDM0002838.1 tetratricopeptide repeat protein [Variovorax sp. J22P240]